MMGAAAVSCFVLCCMSFARMCSLCPCSSSAPTMLLHRPFPQELVVANIHLAEAAVKVSS